MKNFNKQELDEIFARAFAHGCEKPNVFISHSGLKRVEITGEEKQEAMTKRQQLKKENAESYENGTFWLCPMGMDKTGDFSNHRARACLFASNGDHYLVEFTTWTPRGETQEQLHLEFSVNLTEEKQHQNKLKELLKKNENIQRRERSQEDKEEREKRLKQPYYWHETDKAREFLKGKPSTRQTALDCINYLYGTNFKTLEINDLIDPERTNRD